MLRTCTYYVEFCIEFVTNLLKSLLGCVSTTRGFYALRVSVLQKRGILCSYPSHSKLKSSLLSKRSSFFFSLHGKSAASSYGRVDCTQNQNIFFLYRGILWLHKVPVVSFLLFNLKQYYFEVFSVIADPLMDQWQVIPVSWTQPGSIPGSSSEAIAKK